MSKPKINRVLVVDDDEGYRSMVHSILKSRGYTCETAPDGLEALRKIRTGSYDLVVSDIQMPNMDGLELTSQARRELPVLDFIIMTGHTAE